MAKFIRTIADRKKEIVEEILSTKPLLSDDYTYGNIQETSERLLDKLSDEAEKIEEISINPKKKSKEMLPKSDLEKLKEKYPVQQAYTRKSKFSVDEIQDSVDELNVDSDTKDRG